MGKVLVVRAAIENGRAQAELQPSLPDVAPVEAAKRGDPVERAPSAFA